MRTCCTTRPTSSGSRSTAHTPGPASVPIWRGRRGPFRRVRGGTRAASRRRRAVRSRRSRHHRKAGRCCGPARTTGTFRSRRTAGRPGRMSRRRRSSRGRASSTSKRGISMRGPRTRRRTPSASTTCIRISGGRTTTAGRGRKRQILNDSPWSKLVEAERQSKKHEELEAPEGAPKVSGGHQENDEDEDEAEEKHHGREKDEDKEKDEGERQHSKFVVRWVSSRTLREASIRGQVLQGQIPEADADKSLPPAADDYELAVVGTDTTSFQNADESALTNNSYLIAKQSKE